MFLMSILAMWANKVGNDAKLRWYVDYGEILCYKAWILCIVVLFKSY